MDLIDVTNFRRALTREELVLAPGETLLAGGTWLFSEPQPGVRGLVDLTTLGWPPWERLPDGGLRIAATCTVTELLAAPWGRHTGLVRAAVDALVMSFKVQGSATVGGNVALALPAAALVGLLAGLGAEAVVWTADGERRQPVATLVLDVRRTTLAPDEVLRAVDVPTPALAGPAALRRQSLAAHGRSAALVVGRRTDTGTTLVVTAATTRPVVLADVTAAGLASALGRVDCWYDDPHGAPDWREAVTGLLCRQVLDELAVNTGDVA